jgi:hypothetical protein
MHLFSQILFWNETVHVSDSSSVHHQELFSVHTTMVYVIQTAFEQQQQQQQQDQVFHPDPAVARELSTNLYDIHHCCVYGEKLLMMDRRTVRNM